MSSTTEGAVESTRWIDVACASDEAYAMPLCACLASALHFLAPEYRLRVVVLDGGIAAPTRAKLERSLAALAPGRCAITFVTLADAEELRRFPRSGHVNWVSLSRLLLPRLLSDRDKVIWLDCDLVVCDDLAQLWRTPLAASVLAVRESEVGRTLPFAPRYGVPLDAPYFNSGVMVLDLAALRRKDFTSRALAFLEEHPRLRYMDQDVLNILCAKDWAPLDPRWNFVVTYDPDGIEAIARARQRPHPAIVHYASVPKPWHWAYGQQRQYSSYFYYALGLTEWRGWQPPVRAPQVLRTHAPRLYAALKALHGWGKRARRE